MFNIKTYFCKNHKKLMCDLEWVKDEEANVRHHLMTFDPYWLGSLDTAIRAAYDDVNHLTLQLVEKSKPSNIERDGYYVVSAYGEKSIAIRRTFDNGGNSPYVMWKSLNGEENWMKSSSIDDWVILNKIDLDNEDFSSVKEM